MITFTSFKDPVAKEPVADKKGFMTRNWLLWLLSLVKRVQFYQVDTSAGAVNFPLPSAAQNQNVEIVIKKTTPDANTVTPQAVWPGDRVDEVAVLTTSTGATAKARYLSDGVSTWSLV